ncbi:SDR family oxidoreductase [Nocardia farcinica]|uniref:2-(S)-hydroxypropyl-CoM dehydrogenase n=1 Tax=Nocardia farcinica TaxID=37329 RepID=A0A0H5NV82_NOCFR|nr:MULTISPECIES: SDR family oxidoreductase [Nocardia]AXK86312.1 SDR family oxidoreductase [Nocardia farcinica]MBF6138480.1 SDR family oxidoreductase [Nocardia farcinica]MBF6187589.1 SDR family oxidoreductase [Nocardia farcinica]MBF6256213.1 SDR family oxidoreductase [Nocardia farcinica]MBF6263079.1 SDR family oxidoreductase [Nocardia farcinica]
MSSAARIAGKVVVITGGARGIGYATARTLRDLGAQVAIGDVDEAKVKESGAELGLDVYGALDVTDPDSFEAFLDQVERTLGPIDVLVNNAGIMPTGHFADEPDRVSRRILDINVYGVVLGSKLATRRMLERGRGHVINIASLAGVVATPGLATYCASKAAVLALTDTLRLEYRDRGIEFSAVTPTFTNTELVAGTAGAKGMRNAEPEEIAAAVAALITTPRRRVAVTKLAGRLANLQYYVPEKVLDFLGDKLGMKEVFLSEVDQQARAAYERRARGEDDES